MANDFTTALLEAVLALAITASLAYMFLRLAAKRGLFGNLSQHGKLRIEETLRVDPKSSLFIVRIDGRRLLLATHTQSAARLITELQPSSTNEEGGAP